MYFSSPLGRYFHSYLSFHLVNSFFVSLFHIISQFFVTVPHWILLNNFVPFIPLSLLLSLLCLPSVYLQIRSSLNHYVFSFLFRPFSSIFSMPFVFPVRSFLPHFLLVIPRSCLSLPSTTFSLSFAISICPFLFCPTLPFPSFLHTTPPARVQPD